MKTTRIILITAATLACAAPAASAVEADRNLPDLRSSGSTSSLAATVPPPSRDLRTPGAGAAAAGSLGTPDTYLATRGREPVTVSTGDSPAQPSGFDGSTAGITAVLVTAVGLVGLAGLGRVRQQRQRLARS